MAIAEQKIMLKVLSAGIEPKTYAVQSDTGRSIRCIITDWDIPSGSTVKIYIKKPSAAIVYNTCTVNLSTNSVLIELTNQMLAESGLCAAMLEITSSSQTVTTFRFGLIVKDKIAGGSESTTESTVLETLFEQLQAELEAAIEEAATATAAAEAAAAEAAEAAEAANEAVETVGDLTTYVNNIIFSINEDDLGLDVTIND